MSNNLDELSVLENVQDEDQPVAEVEEPEDDSIQKPKKKVYNVKPKDPNAPKKERTEAQKKAWEKALATRQANRESRLKEKEQLNQVVVEQKKIAKQAVEQKIVKKAISIKKKQIKKEEVLDEISDDETPYEEVKQIAKKTANKRASQAKPQIDTPEYQPPQKPSFIFM